MAVGIEINVEIDPRLQGWLNNVGSNFDQALLAGVQAVGNFVAERAQQNAPILRGPLRRSIRAELPREQAGGEYSVLVVAGERYALTQHTLLTPSGPWQLGPVSIRQPLTPEGGVGGAYLRRAAFLNVDRIRDGLAAYVQRGVSATSRIRITARTIEPTRS